MKGGKTHMDKSVQITMIIVVGIVVILGLGYAAFSSLVPNTSNTVTGNGQAVVKAAPDLVKVYFDVRTEGKTSQEAKDKNSEIVDELITALIREGFERKQITTQNFNIYPEYDWSNNRQDLKGYTATHTLVVELATNDSDKVGEVIDAGVGAGAGISYINFELSQEKQNQYKAEAIKLAAEDARLKANALASGVGKSVGDLVSVSDSNFYYQPWNLYSGSGVATDAAMAKEATINIQPGDQEISANVQAIFKLR